MKKFLLLAAIAGSVLLSASATLPQRTTSSPQIKEVTATLHKATTPKSLRKAADAATVIEVPFTHSLGKNESQTSNSYTVIDANGDGRTWKPGGFTTYSVCMAPNTDDVTAADDWLVSPAVRLEAGKYYTVSFEEDMTLNKIEDILALYAGTECSPEGLNIVVVAPHSILYNDKVFVTKETQFSVNADGNYFFGFHCTSKKEESGTVRICNFSIKECENPIIKPDNAIEVPFTHTLGKAAADKPITDQYTVVDADADGKTWKPGAFTAYSVCMRPTDENITVNNDWFISIPVHLLPGVNYTISYETGRTLASGSEEILGVYAGTECSANAMTMEIVKPQTITNKDFEPFSSDFAVAKEGYYYFGFHCTSEKAKSGNLKLCNFAIKESTAAVEPPAAGTLKIEPAPLGELKATVTYTAPETTVQGNPLAQISKVIITTNWAFKTELTDVVPGGVYTIETTDVYNNGYNRFEAVAYIGDVAGEAALTTDIYIGPDNPLPPTGVKIALSDDYKKVTLSWDPVTETGEKGGYVDPSKVTYYIFDAFGSYYDPALATTTETSYTFDYSDFEGQDFVAYQITAGIDETYYSLDAVSDIAVIGEPEELPFYESFADAYYAQSWAVDPASSGSALSGIMYDNELQTNTDADEGVAPEYLNSHDADNGFFFFMPVEKDAAYGFFSTKIDISKAQNPVYEFYYQGKGSVIDAKVAVNGSELKTVSSIDLKENPTDDWTLARIDLAQYKDSKYIQIGVLFRAVHNTEEYIWSVPFDNMRVIDLRDKDIRFSAASVPASASAGNKVPVSITLENIGRQELTAASVEIDVDSKNIATLPIADFTPGKVATIAYGIPTSMLDPESITVEMTVKGDDGKPFGKLHGNIDLIFPKYPMPEALEAEPDNDKVTLKWQAPDFEDLTKPVLVVEDFENPDYELFTYKDFGGFHFVDADGQRNYTFLKDVDNPYRTYPMAYQLFCAEKSGMDPAAIPYDAPAHSGKNMLVAWSCQTVNQNWLISPELSGNAQTISFWARSFTIAYAESFEVLVSTTDADINSFTKIEAVENYPADDCVPETWTEFKAELPEGAKYFAILHNSYDTYALYLDDFTFEKAGEIPVDTKIVSYNIFCDGSIVENKEWPATTTTHTPETSGTYTYRINAVYNYGESRATQPVEVNYIHTGLESLTSAASIICNDRQLTVTAPASTSLAVSTVDGRSLYNGTIAASATIAVPVGIILVTIDGKTTKLAVE